MKVWLPGPLYHAFPLLCILIGFYVAATICNPCGIALALILYIYSYTVLWKRSSEWQNSDN